MRTPEHRIAQFYVPALLKQMNFYNYVVCRINEKQVCIQLDVAKPLQIATRLLFPAYRNLPMLYATLLLLT